MADQPNPAMRQVPLSDGTLVDIPADAGDDEVKGLLSRMETAVQNDKNPQQSSGGSFWSIFGPGAGTQYGTPAQMVANADAATGGKISGAASWLNAKSGGALAPTVNMAGNVAANVAALPWDAPAAITNAITKTARNYGVYADRPYVEYPMIAPQLKQAFGVTPEAGPISSRVENALTIASTGGEGLIPRLVKGVVGEGLSEGGSYAGEKIAENTDPRLAPVLETGGSLAAFGAPYEQVFSKSLTPLRGSDAGSTYDSALAAQDAINAAGGDMTRPPITTGMVGAPFVKQIERVVGAFPVLGQGVQSARENATEGMIQGRDISAEQVGATPTDTTKNSPGTALKYGTEDYLNNVSQRMDNVESAIANNSQGPRGGAALIDVHGLLDDLQNMKTTTDAAGNVHPNVAPQIGAMIDNEISNINRARTPEDPQLHAQLVSQAQGLQFAINAPNTPPQQIPALQAQLAQTVAAIDANMKVPFNVLRQMKTLNSYDVNADGTPTLNGHMGGKVLDAYRDTIQSHVNNLDPQLGAQYQGLNDEYKVASTANRAIANKDEASQTSMLRRGLGAPSAVEDVAGTPVWGEAAGNTIRQMGQNTGKFVPREFAQTWDNMNPAARALYTQTHPNAADQLNNVSQLARNYDIPSEAGGSTKALAALLALDKFLEGVGVKGALAAIPVGYLGQSMPTIRAVAGRPQPYFQSLQQNIPALMAVARNQAQNNPLGQ